MTTNAAATICPRLAIVGARRAQQGLGPYLARDLTRAGARVVAFVVTSPATVIKATEHLQKFGIEARGYTSLDELLRREQIDGLVIATPAKHHEPYLRSAIDARLHTLCEKPLIWGGTDLVERTRALVQAFAERRLMLEENCQWPWVLPAFRMLHPHLAANPKRFVMELSPEHRGLTGLSESLSHPLSLLQALAPQPKPEVDSISYDIDPESGRIELGFRYVTTGNEIDTRVNLQPGNEFPRPASLEIDAHRAARRILLPEYRMQLADGLRTVPLADPLTARITNFVETLRGVLSGTTPPDPAFLIDRMRMLVTLTGQFPQ